MSYLGPKLKLNKLPFIQNNKSGGGFKEVSLIKVIDGDTARFLIDEKNIKVRFLVVDTPEIKPHQQPYAKMAKEYTNYILTKAKKIYLQTDPFSSLYDDTPEKRLLAWIWTDNELLNYNLIEQGFSQIKYVKNPNLLYLDDLNKALEISHGLELRLNEGSE